MTAFYLLETDHEKALRLAQAIVEVKDRIRLCERCFNVGRDRALHDLLPIRDEPDRHLRRGGPAGHRGRRAGTGNSVARYHVLGGALSPIDGIGPEQLRVRPCSNGSAPRASLEVILCTNPNLEGEATAMYLAGLLVAPRRSRWHASPSGLPVGGDLEYADELTLGRALEGRRVRG